MKFFLFSDLHANSKALNNIFDYIEKNKPDAVLFAGDFVNMGEPVWYAKKFIEGFKKINIPFFWVPGNNDFGRSYHKVQATIKSVEGRMAKFGEERIAGVGGSPASWAGQYEGETNKNKINIAGTIFISHVPPPGVFNWLKNDTHSPIGSKKFSDSPKVHICGHIHHKEGIAYLGETKIIKLASAEHGHAAIMDTDDLNVEFIKIGNKSILE